MLPSIRQLSSLRIISLQVRRASSQEHSKQLVLDDDDKKSRARAILEKEYPDHYKDGKFATRVAYVDFIDQTLSKMEELGIAKDIEAYKELLRVFPPGKYHPKHFFETFGLQNAPQQLAAIRILHQMETNKIRPDKEVEALVISAFSKSSNPWLKIARMNYWTTKGRNIDLHPLPEKLPERPHEVAKVALGRMIHDPQTILTVTNTSRVPTSIDKTWIVFAQNPTQKSIIEKLDPKCTLHLEEAGLTFVDKKFLSYYTLRCYDDEETFKRKTKQPELEFNYNTVKVKFFGKPLQEKLQEPEMAHYVDGSYILAIGITGTSSHDSLLSWLKILQERNPNLKQLNVVFDINRPTPEMITTDQQ